MLTAYRLAGGCRYPAFSGLGPPDWRGIKTVLKLHGLWRRRVQRRLDLLLALIADVVRREHDEAKGG